MVIQLMKKNKMNLDEQITNLYNSVYSADFHYSDGIWENFLFPKFNLSVYILQSLVIS